MAEDSGRLTLQWHGSPTLASVRPGHVLEGPYLLRWIASSLTAEFCISSANVAVNLLLFGRLLDGSAMLQRVRELISIPGYAI